MENIFDSQLEAVAAAVKKLDPEGLRTAQVLRKTVDQLYDGQRTGRYSWDKLYKTEKTHCGTLVEINLQREFLFHDGGDLDYRIDGIEVDCKFSQRLGGWMIPPEARDQICLVVWAEDNADPKWSMGLVRTTANNLNAGNNRDAKATLSIAGRDAINWLFKNKPLPPNVLLQLDKQVVEQIMSLKSGQKRINALFRSALCMIIGRAVIATVAQQDDYMKRVRANGGARTALKPEGIIILGQYDLHAKIAEELGVPIPGDGDSVGVRIIQAANPGPGVTQIDGRLWRVAQAQDPVQTAPNLPKIKKARR